MSGDISKLPVWARREIEHLRGKVARLTALLGEGPQDTNTRIKRFTTADTPLQPGEQIEFRLQPSDRQAITARVMNGFGDGAYLEVSCLGGSLVMIPQVTNVVRIRVEGH